MATVFGYWAIKGLGQPCRLLLELAGEEYQDNRFDQLRAEDVWIQEKAKNPHGLPFPNLPYYVDGDQKLTQSSAIVRHLGRKYNMAANNDAEASQLDMLEGVVIDVRTWFFDLCYQTEEGFKAGLPEAVQRSTTYCQQLNAYLGSKPWFLGDRITYVDVMAYDMLTNWRELEPKVLDGSDNLKQLVDRFEALPNIKKYMESDRFIKPINAHMAVFGAAK
ncbi:Glutathione S-transferase Mu 1 [Amphibalanus amphitrite]|uniref:glutathione transferase n=1 Tax=Amphibalanus amphitrite TaxID=1232801 RepID=A0A6A4X343_AMPAM|nr:Glutathione S-transferase Mu 1 [Amphibalanus amphitrite]